jgi:hypothetical protein
MGFSGKHQQQSSHAVSFLLGAALPTALLFFLASDRLGVSLPTISSSWRGSGTTAVLQTPAATPSTLAAADDRAAPAQDHHEVRMYTSIKLRSTILLSFALHPIFCWTASSVISVSMAAHALLHYHIQRRQREQRCVLEPRNHM